MRLEQVAFRKKIVPLGKQENIGTIYHFCDVM